MATQGGKRNRNDLPALGLSEVTMTDAPQASEPDILKLVIAKGLSL